MSVAGRILFWVAGVGTVTSTIYSLMVAAAAVRFGVRKRREDGAPERFLPAVSVLKPLHGAEPDLEENIRGFFRLEYPEFELMFCARQEGDAGLGTARRVAAEYPGVRARFLTCGEPEFPNAKMWSLKALAEAAEHDVLVTSDADARVDRDYLRRCVQVLEDGTVALASCLYVGRTTGGFWAQMDAVGKSVEMSGGILVADMLEGTRFALGVTMILRKQAFAEAGGYEELGQWFAEDFVLGSRLAEKGLGVRMSNHVIRLMVLPQGFAGAFRDQLRWMKSTRRSRPAGHLGTGLTFAVPFGVIGLVWGLVSGNVGVGLLWLLGTCVDRWMMSAVVLWALGDERAMVPVLLYPLRDLLGGVLWVGSYTGGNLRYRAGAYELGADGRFVALG